jgi:hypothetical protein
MSDRKLAGNKFVALGLFLLVIFGAIWFLPDAVAMPNTSFEIPGLEITVELPVLLGILGTTLVIFGFWRGW